MKKRWHIQAFDSEDNFTHDVKRAFHTKRGALRHARTNFPHAVVYRGEKEVVF